MDALSLHSCFLEAFRVSRLDPSRQVSMSAARAASPGFTEGQNIKKRCSKPQISRFGEGGSKKIPKNPYIFFIYLQTNMNNSQFPSSLLVIHSNSSAIPKFLGNPNNFLVIPLNPQATPSNFLVIHAIS